MTPSGKWKAKHGLFNPPPMLKDALSKTGISWGRSDNDLGRQQKLELGSAPVRSVSHK